MPNMLIDSYGRKIDYLRISVTDKCDLRCLYCIPKGFKSFTDSADYLSFDEIIRIVTIFADLGVKHYRITGGEPLLRKNISLLINRIAKINGVEDLSLTTNGTLLTQQAVNLQQAGLKRFNISLDSLNKNILQKITGRDVLTQVMAGLNLINKLGFKNTKINMVALEDINYTDIELMLKFCIENKFILRLIEVMPMGKSGQNYISHNSLYDLITKLTIKYGLQPTKSIFGGGPAAYWTNSDHSFYIGIITPMSRHFCETCNRIRLSAKGDLLMCLGEEHQVSLKDILRLGCTDSELKEYIQKAILLKPKQHEFNSKPKKIIRIMSMTGG